MFRQDS